MKHIKLFEAFSDDIKIIHADLKRAKYQLESQYRDREKQLCDRYIDSVELCVTDLIEDYDAI